MSEQLTHHPIYNTLDRDDFAGMIENDRYGSRSSDFDEIISATVDHFWDPLDPRYIDFNQPFDQTADTIMPREFCIELQSEVAGRLDEGQQIALANQNTRFQLSSILHGEQGALSLSASLTMILKDPGAQEYAANQTREEARHVTGYTNDPLLQRLVQFVMTDEAFHHKFGKIWADKTIPNLTEQEHEIVENWAAECFQHLLFNLINAEQKQEIYAEFGLDWKWVRSAVMEAFTDETRRDRMTESTDIFRVLIKTLLKCGIITDRTRHIYAQWVDMDELHREDPEVVGSEVAVATMEILRDINGGRKKIGKALRTVRL